MPLPALDIFVRRRARVAAALAAAGGGIAVVPTAPIRQRNGDSDHAFRHDSYFHWLTGFTEPGACLLLDASGRAVLFAQPKDEAMETWTGHRLGPEAAVAELGVDAAFPSDDLDAKIPSLLDGQPAVWTLFGVQPGLEGRVAGWLATLRALERTGASAPAAHRDLCPLLDDMRLVKDAHELAVMRRAAHISADAHRRAMRACRPGMREYELEAELLYEFRRRGAQAPAYDSIVAAGANACVLHYPAGNAVLQAGELCLIDAGCELDGYAADITRTFPVDGRFTPAQRRLYDIVLAAQDAAAAQTKPGARQRDAHTAALKVLVAGMLDVGLLSQDRHGDVDAVIASGAYQPFYMHGTGHWLGMDVHDVGHYQASDEPPVEQPDGRGGSVVKRPSRVLQPGMVVTLEPGLYVRKAEGVPEAYWNIGIRIEDDAVVTPGGCELISRGVPVLPDEIEALMRAG